MARTTPQAVEAILGRNYDARRRPNLQPYIETANSVVSTALDLATERRLTVPSATLELMERWMAAHYYTKTDPTYKSRSNLGASGSFNSDPDDFKNVAINLDPTGMLSLALSSEVVFGEWLGRPPSEQTDYVDRD